MLSLLWTSLSFFQATPETVCLENPWLKTLALNRLYAKEMSESGGQRTPPLFTRPAVVWQALPTVFVPRGRRHDLLSARLLGPYAPQGSASLLPKLSVTSKVSPPTSCAWVGSRVHIRSSEDLILLEFTSPVDREYMRRRRKCHCI